MYNLKTFGLQNLFREILGKTSNIDAVGSTMGGQTALNLCIESDTKGIWEDFGVKIIGVDIDAINITEDREKNSVSLMLKFGIRNGASSYATSFF